MITSTLRRAHCAAASIRTGGGVAGGYNKEVQAAVSSVVHIHLLRQEEQK